MNEIPLPGRLGLAPVEHDPFAGPAIECVVPITEPQREIWLAVELDQRASLAFNEATEITLRGVLDVERARHCWQRIVDRHEALRSSFSPDGSWICIHQDFALEIPFEDLSALSGDQREARLAQVRAEEVRRPFDIERGELLSVRIFRLSEREHRVFFTAHHIIVDGWSAAEIYKDFARLYDGDADTVAPSFAVFAREQSAWLQSAEARATESWWLNQFSDGVPGFELPTDRPRPAQHDFRGGHLEHRLSPELVASLRRVGARYGSSLVATMLASFAALLQRLSGSEDVVVGLAASAQSYLQQSGLVGHAVNLLPLRLKPRSELTFAEFLTRTRGDLLDAFDHQRFTFSSLLPKLSVRRDRGGPPLVPVVFNIDVRNDPVSPQGIEVVYRTVPRDFENFELYLNLVDDGRDLLIEANYSATLYDATTISRWLLQWQRMLEGLCEMPTQPIWHLPIVDADEYRQLLAPPAIAHPPRRNLQEWFAATVAANASAIALSFEQQSLTYAELDARANQLAQALRARGVGPEVRVGLLIEPSLESVIAILGVLKSGGAYVPVDSVYPDDRIHYIFEDAAVALVLTKADLLPRLPAAMTSICLDRDWDAVCATQPASAPQFNASPDDLAYVIYTSGSTGRPKGCLLTHANVSRLFTSTQHWFAFDTRDVWTLFHSCAFDFSVWEIWGALLYGGRVVVVPYWISRDAEKFLGLLASESVTVLNQTPSAFRALIAADEESSGALSGKLALRYVVFGGEALDFQSLRPWFSRHGDGRDRGPTLINMYGITETTVHVTYRPLSMDDLDADPPRSFIGQPIPDLSLQVLDAHREPAAPGAAGELYVGGAGLARGYLNRAELSAERFIADPHHQGQRLYRTGDLARRLPNGDVEYLGRIDHQVKLRGFRIELGEIETALNEHATVAEAACGVLERSPGDARLVAWCALKPQASLDPGDLRAHLRQRLPPYMVPQHFVAMDQLPRSNNLKLDRRALPSPFAQLADSSSATSKAPLQTPAEQRIAELIREVLGPGLDIGRDDRFVELGGHSLLAVQLAARLSKLAGHRLSTRVVLMDTVAGIAAQMPDVAELAAAAVTDASTSTDAPASDRPRPGLFKRLFGQR